MDQQILAYLPSAHQALDWLGIVGQLFPAAASSPSAAIAGWLVLVLSISCFCLGCVCGWLVRGCLAAHWRRAVHLLALAARGEADKPQGYRF